MQSHALTVPCCAFQPFEKRCRLQWLPLVAGMVAMAAPAGAQSAAPIHVDSLPVRPLLSASALATLERMTPIFDGRSLDGWIQVPVAPIRFATEDVKDAPALARRISRRADPIAAFLAEHFDADANLALASIVAGQNASRQDVSAILRNLNRIVSGGVSLFTAERFRRVTLQPETQSLLQSAPDGLRLPRLNRLLLEDGFPTELARSPDQAWRVKDGAMASTGAGRGVIFSAADYSHYRLVFQVRQISGNHVPGVLIFGERPPPGELGLDALGAIQFQVPNGGHWDYRPGRNRDGENFTRPVRIRFHLHAWAQVEMLVNAKTGRASMAVAQPIGTRGIEVLSFNDSAAGRAGPIAWQMHNAGLFDEFRDVRIELNPAEDRLITVE
jgi:hypothetical protein